MNTLIKQQTLAASPIDVRTMARRFIQKLREYLRIRNDMRQLEYMSNNQLQDMGLEEEFGTQIWMARQMRSAELLRHRQIW